MKDKSRIRSDEFVARLTEEEAKYFRELSFRLGLSYSQLLRFCAMYCVRLIAEKGSLPEGFID